MKLFNLGASVSDSKPEERKIIAWPLAPWKCLVPDDISPNINALEKLVLSLVDQQIATSERDIELLLCCQLSFDSDLVAHVLSGCRDKNYLDKNNTTEMKLTEKAEAILHNQEELMEDSSFSVAENKVYLFQDMVTNTIVPCFDIRSFDDSLQESFDDVIDISSFLNAPQRFSKVGRHPGAAAMNNAIRQWRRIQQLQADSEPAEPGTINTATLPHEETDNMFADNVATLSGAEQSYNPLRIEETTRITIWSDKSYICKAIAYLAVNRNDPSQIEVFSPFGELYNNWFARIVDRLRVISKQFDEELKLFSEIKREELKDRIAFGNEEQIMLLNEFPAVCNNTRYAGLKKCIIDLYKDVRRITSGEDDTKHFDADLRTAIERLFKDAIYANPIFCEIKDKIFRYPEPQRYGAYCNMMQSATTKYKLGNDTHYVYSSRGICANLMDLLKKGPNDKCHMKECIALIILYANEDNNSCAARYVSDYGSYLIKLYDWYGMGSNATHLDDRYHGKQYSVEQCGKLFDEFSAIFRNVFTYLIEEGHNG